ncbi:RDD family protein [Brevibacillus sp. SAFN-007a]|uniref:RDD family protein n=1 Tax=Brevibacillus sp. SAFN-007a TaxID=3436862 RepID=UPI003F805D73
MKENPSVKQTGREASVVTPEHVMLRFQTAGLGSRAAAQLIDSIILFLVNLTVFVAISIVILGRNDYFFLEKDNYAIALAVLLIFLLHFGYFLLFEAFWSGQTIGKRWMGIRVIRDNGQPATFLSSTIRNLFRIVDLLPSGYFLGALVSFFHPRDKRIGDLVAGTIVVVEGGERTGRFRKRKRRKQVGMAALAEPLVLREQQKQALTREDWLLLATFIARQDSLAEERKQELAKDIARLLQKKLAYAEEESPQEEPMLFLERLYRTLQSEWSLEN